jgi:hypothetical protein
MVEATKTTDAPMIAEKAALSAGKLESGIKIQHAMKSATIPDQRRPAYLNGRSLT